VVASKRERIIGLVTAGVLAVLALDRLVLTPLTERRNELDAKLAAAQLELTKADGLFTNGRRLTRTWNAMLDGGLKSDVPAAEGQALHALRDWGQEADLPQFKSLKPERVETQKQFRVVTIRLSTTGSMRSISEFLWRVQEADIPMRVTDMQINSNKEGTDDLTLTLGVSTLSLAPDETPAGGGRQGQSVASAAAAAGTFAREGTR
jgi:hypothetical protein